jgi:hypothetical protein
MALGIVFNTDGVQNYCPQSNVLAPINLSA